MIDNQIDMSQAEKIVQPIEQLDPRRQPGWWEAKARARAQKEYEKLKAKEKKRDEKLKAKELPQENNISLEPIEPVQVSEIQVPDIRLPNGKWAPGLGPGRPLGVKNKRTRKQLDRAEKVLRMIESKFLEYDIEKLTPIQRATLWKDLLEYAMPRKARMEHEGINQDIKIIQVFKIGDQIIKL